MSFVDGDDVGSGISLCVGFGDADFVGEAVGDAVGVADDLRCRG